MADDTAGNIAPVSQNGNIQGLTALMNALFPAGSYKSSQTSGPQTTTTSGNTVTTGDKTTTSQEIASPEAIQNLIQQMLQGNSGLAQIAQGEKGAGLYNTSTNQQLMNDLMSRAAAAGAALNKKTVQTTSGGTVTTSGGTQTTSGQTTDTSKTMTPQLGMADIAKIIATVGAGAAGASAISNLLKSGAGAAANALKPGPQGNGGGNGGGLKPGAKRNGMGADDPVGTNAADQALMDYTNSAAYDKNFTSVLDASGINNSAVDSPRTQAGANSMSMAAVADQNFEPLMNQNTDVAPVNLGSSDMGNSGAALTGDTGFRNISDSGSAPMDSGSGGGIDVSAAMAPPASDPMSNVTLDPTPAPAPMESAPAAPAEFQQGSSFNNWDEYNKANPNGEAGDRFNIAGSDYILTSADNAESMSTFESSNPGMDFNSADAFANFNWTGYDQSTQDDPAYSVYGTF